MEKIIITNQLNNYFLDPATTYNDIIAIKNNFSEEEWEEYYKELSPDAKARVDSALKFEKIQNKILDSDTKEEDIINVKKEYSEEDWKEYYKELSPEAQERVKEAEEWKRKKDEEDSKPWWQKALEWTGGHLLGIVSFSDRLLEKGVDFTISTGSALLSKATYLLQLETGVDMQEFRDAVEGWSKDFIAEDWTKKKRNTILYMMGANDAIREYADEGEDFTNEVNRGIIKTAASLLKPPYRYIASGALASDTYAEEIQTAYQRGATYDEGLVSAFGCSAVDFLSYSVKTSGALAAGGKSFVGDTAKDAIKYFVYENRNTDALTFWKNSLDKSSLRALISFSGAKISSGSIGKAFIAATDSALAPTAASVVRTMSGNMTKKGIEETIDRAKQKIEENFE